MASAPRMGTGSRGGAAGCGWDGEQPASSAASIDNRFTRFFPSIEPALAGESLYAMVRQRHAILHRRHRRRPTRWAPPTP